MTHEEKAKIRASIRFEQPMIDGNHKNSMWYGGDVLSLEYKNHAITMRANGDVIAFYQSDPTDKTVIEVRDKSCHGIFYEKLHNAIEGDAELLALSERDESPCYAYLDITDNNWWEVFVTAPDGSQLGSTVLDSMDYDAAIDEILDDLENLVAE